MTQAHKSKSRIMKFFSHMRSKSKLRHDSDEAQVYHHYVPGSKTIYKRGGPNPTAKIPVQLLSTILSYVCPHSQDDTYTTCEDSMLDGGVCMLCDMRDLAHCALVSRQWAEATQRCLYHSIRFDAVHYCQREIDLAEKRKRRSFFDRNGNPEDAPMQRLQLFSRSVRENQFIAIQVQCLKMPYMTRESYKSDLARTVSVLPNLRYVDLPEGFFSDDPSCDTLRQELQSRCGEIRRMRYCAGGEGSFTMLQQRRQWQNLEVLELSHLGIEPTTLVNVLASFPALHEVTLDSLPLLDNTVFSYNPEAAPFPPIASLTLENTPNVSANGLVAYLSRKDTREVFTSIRLVNTGILPSTLYKILAASPYLSSVHMSENVSRPLSQYTIPPLSSRSLKSLHYEISSPTASPHNRQSPQNLQDPTESYYLYLSSSILSGALSSLTSLYALSTSLPSLLLPLPSAPFASSQKPQGVSRPLHLYTKSISELEWEYTLITPPTSTNRRGSATQTRPLSLQLGPQWGTKARDSVMVGNGFGGFLAVPNEEAARPGTPGGRGHKKNGGGWMG